MVAVKPIKAARFRWLSIGFFLFGIFSIPVLGEVSANQQKMVKSAFVLNIAKFVTWPESVYQMRPKQLVLCMYQADALGVGFEIIRNRSVNGRRLAKRVVDGLDEAENCDVLFLDGAVLSNYSKDLGQNYSDLPLRGVLVVVDRTSSEESSEKSIQGVQVTLVRRAERIGFEINLAESRSAQLKLSSELLKLSTIVGGS